MKQHRQKTAGLALMTVAALIMTAWAGSAVADRPAKTVPELAKKGYAYEVFRSQADRPDHDGALIMVVQTREKDPQAIHGLTFVQTSGDLHVGEGIVCWHSDPRPSHANIQGDSLAPPDASLECHQHVQNIKETLSVGTLNSEFCNDLRTRYQSEVKKDPGKKATIYTKRGENPIVTQDECDKQYNGSGQCLCYEIKHERKCDPDKGCIPPNSGSGSGGHS